LDKKNIFLTDDLSEEDRASALGYVIREFDILKSKSDDELIHKRRQTLLAIWGGLVLARKDTSPRIALAADPVDVELNDVEAIQSGEDYVELMIHANESLGQSLEDIVAVLGESPVQEIQMSSPLEAEDGALYTNSSVNPNMADTHKAVELSSDEPLTEEPNAEAILAENKAVFIEESLAPELPNGLQSEIEVFGEIDNNTSTTSTIIPNTVQDVEEKANISYAIEGVGKALESSYNSVFEPIPESTENILSKIFDVNMPAEKVSFDIKEITSPSEKIVTHLPVSENAKSFGVHNSNLIRLKLLKTGVLHDLVLPQGTIVSTLAADAEELIASGTAEKLLIQIDTEDE